jgi:hypothetical protein
MPMGTPHQTLVDLLDDIAVRFGDRPALGLWHDD